MNEEEKTMEIKEEEADRLLKAIFSEGKADSDDDDDYTETISDKVGYAEYIASYVLTCLAPAIQRLSHLHRLLLVSGKDGANSLPDIITNNEAGIALRHLLHVENDIKEITKTITEIYKNTKKPEGKT